MMSKSIDVPLAILVPILVLVYLSVAPYTKVEESFNVQATRDILAAGIPFHNSREYLLSHYDHLAFPGSVPRTFVGALVLAGAAWPFAWLVYGVHRQILVRAILGIYNSFCILSYRNAIAKAYGRETAAWYLVLQASQFHIMFWSSRTLPNFFAFGLSRSSLFYWFVVLTVAGTYALRSFVPALNIPKPGTTEASRFAYEQQRSIAILTVLGIVFRSEISVILFTHTVAALIQRNLTVLQVVVAGSIGATIGLCLTVPIDSFFWQRFPLWPELEGFMYNILHSQASNWGISPWHHYFTSALPKLLLNPMTLLGVFANLTHDYLSSQGRALVLPSIAFIAIYSLIPHKEWRFIVYAVPPLTASAARLAAWFWIRRDKPVSRLGSLLFQISVLVSFGASFILLLISSLNYPGAEAINRLHAIAHGTQPTINVHMDTLSCMTGVTRFLQIPDAHMDGVVLRISQLDHLTKWVYDKTDNETELLRPEFWKDFDYVLTENTARVPGSWEIVYTAKGYSGMRFRQRKLRDTEWERSMTDAEIRYSNPWSYGDGPWMATERWLGKKQGLLKRIESLLINLTGGTWGGLKMGQEVNILRRAKEPGG